METAWVKVTIMAKTPEVFIHLSTVQLMCQEVTLYGLDTRKASQMLTNTFGGLARISARPDVQLSRAQVCAYVPPKLCWEFWKAEEKLVLLPKPQQVAYNEHRHLSQAAGGLHIWGFLTLNIQTASRTHEVTKPRSFISPTAS